MNQFNTGKFIALKRKEKNYTQEQLAQKLQVSNKTISKWENGRSMPDYAVINDLCEVLDISVSELLNGKEVTPASNNDEQILDLLRRTQELEKQKEIIFSVLLIIMGIALQALSYAFNGSNIKDFVSGMLLGISIGEMLLGIYTLARTYRKS